jgi:nucleotide-binding universal stress UspA family protein
MVDAEARPVVVAYDGSPEAEAAVRAAAQLFGERRLVIVSVWEPGLAAAMAPLRDPTGIGYAPPAPEEMIAVDQAQRDHAQEAAEAGAQLARSLGATAEAYPVPDEADIADTLAGIAEHCDAGALVVGSRGLGYVKSRLLGSTSRQLLERSDRPVLVVRRPH